MRLPSGKKICKEVTCVGGPWDGQVAWFPVQEHDDPLSLPFRVPGFYGRYNLNNGKWVSLFTEAEQKRQELL